MAQGIGIQYPLERDKQKNHFLKSVKTTKEKVRSRILFLLDTPKGSIYYNPSWGSNLRRFVFDPNDSKTEADIKEDIKSVVEEFIGRVKVGEISFERPDRKTLILTVQYLYIDADYRDEDKVSLTYNFEN